MKNNRSHIVMLLLAAFFWGTTFVAQSIGADYVEANTYLAGRSWIAVVLLPPIVHLMDTWQARRGVESRKPRTKADRRLLLMSGTAIGITLWVASAAQQTGIAYTTTAKASFITALYIVIVPLLSIFLRKRPPLRILFCVLISLCGLYLLCMTSDRFSLELGDTWVLISAFFFSLEIMLVDHFGPHLDGIRLSRMQFFVVAVFSTAAMLLTESPTLESVRMGFPAILYAGVFSSGVAYTLQILGQEDVNPTVASLVMSLESVFGAVSGWLILKEVTSPRELAGCVLMFISILLAQIEPPRHRKPQAPGSAAGTDHSV